jgi:hypothetical protein
LEDSALKHFNDFSRPSVDSGNPGDAVQSSDYSSNSRDRDIIRQGAYSLNDKQPCEVAALAPLAAGSTRSDLLRPDDRLPSSYSTDATIGTIMEHIRDVPREGQDEFSEQAINQLKEKMSNVFRSGYVQRLYEEKFTFSIMDRFLADPDLKDEFMDMLKLDIPKNHPSFPHDVSYRMRVQTARAFQFAQDYMDDLSGFLEHSSPYIKGPMVHSGIAYDVINCQSMRQADISKDPDRIIFSGMKEKDHSREEKTRIEAGQALPMEAWAGNVRAERLIENALNNANWQEKPSEAWKTNPKDLSQIRLNLDLSSLQLSYQGQLLKSLDLLRFNRESSSHSRESSVGSRESSVDSEGSSVDRQETLRGRDSGGSSVDSRESSVGSRESSSHSRKSSVGSRESSSHSRESSVGSREGSSHSRESSVDSRESSSHSRENSVDSRESSVDSQETLRGRDSGGSSVDSRESSVDSRKDSSFPYIASRITTTEGKEYYSPETDQIQQDIGFKTSEQVRSFLSGAQYERDCTAQKKNRETDDVWQSQDQSWHLSDDNRRTYYEKVHPAMAHYTQSIIEHLVTKDRNTKKITLLDIAGGNGDLGERIIKDTLARFPDLEITYRLVDYSKSDVELANERFNTLMSDSQRVTASAMHKDMFDYQKNMVMPTRLLNVDEMAGRMAEQMKGEAKLGLPPEGVDIVISCGGLLNTAITYEVEEAKSFNRMYAKLVKPGGYVVASGLTNISVGKADHIENKMEVLNLFDEHSKVQMHVVRRPELPGDRLRSNDEVQAERSGTSSSSSNEIRNVALDRIGPEKLQVRKMYLWKNAVEFTKNARDFLEDTIALKERLGKLHPEKVALEIQKLEAQLRDHQINWRVSEHDEEAYENKMRRDREKLQIQKEIQNNLSKFNFDEWNKRVDRKVEWNEQLRTRWKNWGSAYNSRMVTRSELADVKKRQKMHYDLRSLKDDFDSIDKDLFAAQDDLVKDEQRFNNELVLLSGEPRLLELLDDDPNSQ